MPLPLTVSCFSKIQIGFAFLVPAHPGSPGQRAVKRVCVCVCVCDLATSEVDIVTLVALLILVKAHMMVMTLCTVACWHWWVSSCRWVDYGHWQSFHWNFTRCSLRQVIHSRLSNAYSVISYYNDCASSALALLVGRQEGHPACKNWVVVCWRGYLSGVRCRLAYGPADATATHCLLLQWNPDWFYLSGTGSPW